MLDWLFNFSSARLGTTWGPAAYATDRGTRLAIR